MISTVHEYLLKVESIYKSLSHMDTTLNLWFRGVSDATYKMVPKIYRDGSKGLYEREMIRDFSLYSGNFFEYIPDNYLEKLFIMQHYGMSTRLLDWSESSLVGLFFSVIDYRNTNNAAVYVMDPWSLNTVAINQKSVTTIDNPLLNDYTIDMNPQKIKRSVRAKIPVAVRPKRDTERINAQKGFFTIHGNNPRPLDDVVKRADKNGVFTCEQIMIDGTKKLEIIKELSRMGITYSVVFPEKIGIVKDIDFRYSRDYLNNKKTHVFSGLPDRVPVATPAPGRGTNKNTPRCPASGEGGQGEMGRPARGVQWQINVDVTPAFDIFNQ